MRVCGHCASAGAFFIVLAGLLLALPVAAVASAGTYDGNQSAPAGNEAAHDSETIIHILALGDSLTAGYGLEEADSYPAVLQRKLTESGWPVKVVNAGVSGDTSAGGLARVGWALGAVPEGKVDLVIVGLGANDALRGLPPQALRKNLAGIVEQCLSHGARVLLVGMQAPRNMGADYAQQFDAVYPDLADKYNIALYPFLLEGVALDPDMNLKDGMHPNAEGVKEIVKRLSPAVVKELEKL